MNTATWHEANGYTLAYAETADPRVLAVIQLDQEPSAPYGDALAPAYCLEHRYDWTTERAGDVYHDGQSDRAAAAYAEALEHFYGRRDREAIAARYLHIFHGITALHLLQDGSGAGVLIFDTPNYREHVGGIAGDDPLKGEREEWRAYLDGDVYGIGYAVNEARTTAETPVGDVWDDFDVQIECWGFYGRDYAEESAAAFEMGAPDLAPLIDQEGLVFA